MTRPASLNDPQLRKLKRLAHVVPTLKAHEIAQLVECTESVAQHWLGVLRGAGKAPRYRARTFKKHNDANGLSDAGRRIKEREASMGGDKRFAELINGRSYAGA